MSKTKIPRAAAKLLPFRGTVFWPLPDEIEPIQFQHPPVKARAGRRKSADSAQANPVAPKDESKELAGVEEKQA